MSAKLVVPPLAAALLLLAAPSESFAQHRGSGGRPVHVTTVETRPPAHPPGPVHVVHSRSPSDRYEVRQAFASTEALVASARDAARPYAEHESQRQVDLACAALEAARAELGPWGSEHRFYANLGDAELHARAALSRVRELAAELEGLRAEASRQIRQAELAARGYFSVGADRLIGDASTQYAAAERAQWRGDYTLARAQYAAAIDTARLASATIASLGRPGRGHGHGDAHHHGSADHWNGGRGGAVYAGYDGGCSSQGARPRSW